MSDSSLRFIPINPMFQPVPATVDLAKTFLQEVLPLSVRITASFLPRVEFIDAGANWQGVQCPLCNADAEPWWGDAMSIAAQTEFQSLDVVSLCCQRSVSLNELGYGWAVGFARFVLEAHSPHSQAITAQQLDKLGSILTCNMRQISVHV